MKIGTNYSLNNSQQNSPNFGLLYLPRNPLMAGMLNNKFRIGKSPADMLKIIVQGTDVIIEHNARFGGTIVCMGEDINPDFAEKTQEIMGLIHNKKELFKKLQKLFQAEPMPFVVGPIPVQQDFCTRLLIQVLSLKKEYLQARQIPGVDAPLYA